MVITRAALKTVPTGKGKHGLQLERWFTTDGVHPYDEIEWELRDAIINDFKTGGVAFEQRDVEFPKSWSMNATTIVAQKYFRGPLGSPERERSVRQMIDRVAETITAWGVKDGYFADAESAEVFADELKHLLVNQKAAFNSPVWFNIGVPGRAQQASACYILSVDDQMSSILNWYVEEGIIFKGGSGAGVNLSKIRSSKEQLKGGGTASGPVSFMRGADASAGTIKCLHRDTPVVTDGGVAPIGEVHPGSRVLTRHGFKRIEAVHDNGRRPLVRLTTDLGEEVLCTPEHRFWVRGSAGEAWKEAKDIGPDDRILVDLGATAQGSWQPLTPVNPGHHHEIQHTLPEVLDEAFALWLGWVYGDGSITTRQSANFIAVQIGDGDTELAGRYEAITRTVFGESAHLFTDRHTDKPDASASVRFCSTQVIRFLEANGLRKGSAHELRTPPLVQSSPAPVRAAFLSGLFEADGGVSNGYPHLSTVSQGLAQDVQRLLLSLGIPSRLRVIHERSGAYGTRPIHHLRVVGAEGVRTFAKLVGYVSERKSALLAEAVRRRDASPFEGDWVMPHVQEELGQIWEAGDQTLRRLVAPYCRYAAPRAMSLLRARALVERFPEAFAGTAVERFAAGAEFWTRVTVEPAGEGPTVDLTVADVHEYLVHNLVTHNSGGTTRRAAKMVILNVDHPDVEEFIWCKQREEVKARALREAGFDMDLDGLDSNSVQYQNANNSVRVTDEFMEAVEADAEFALKAVLTGEPVRTLEARELMRQVAQAAWECADPGMQYDTTINDWHTTPNAGRINGSNPCFPGDARVHTDKGLIPFEELIDRVREGETFGVYTHDATNPDHPVERMELTSPEAFMITGRNPIVKLRFSNGIELRCTPGHRIFTANRGYVPAEDLTPDDKVKAVDLPTPAINAERALLPPSDVLLYRKKGDWPRSLALPEKWSEDLAHYLGWLVGDGCISGDVITTAYGNREDQEHVLPSHRSLIAEINDGREPRPSEQPNGTIQLRQSRRIVAEFFRSLGVSESKAAEKTVPWSVEQAPPDAVAAFLRGLFDADGCVYNGDTSRYVGLGSVSPELLRGVQRLLSTFGIHSRIYRIRDGIEAAFSYTRKDGSEATYDTKPLYDLRISGPSVATFAQHIGFSLPAKDEKLATAVRLHAYHRSDETIRLVERAEDGVELTYNLSEPRNHSYVVNGVCVRNCSEYMHLDNSACNLASLNLRKFESGGVFDADAFKRAVEIVFSAQEILVGNSSYPTEKIAENARAYRQLGLGYANLGGLLMSQGLAYDSDEGRAWAAAITALMTGHAYRTSAELAHVQGPFDGFAADREGTLRVIAKHGEAAEQIDPELAPANILEAAKQSWSEALELGSEHGIRNAQASVLAPTGCLVGGSLVATERGLVRLGSLGDPAGEQWQDLGVQVATDEGPREATQFYVNGLESVVTVDTARGYRIQGTPRHRIKVVEPDGRWVWKRFEEIGSGDRLPLALNQLVGEPQEVVLAASQHAPARMTPQLAEFVGYFMGDGALTEAGLRLSVATQDFDVVEHLARLGKDLFDLEARVETRGSYADLTFTSAELVAWWRACGFADRPLLPDAVLAANDRSVYTAFLRGLFEADGAVNVGCPALVITSPDFARDVQSLLLALGYPVSRSSDETGWSDSALAVIKLLSRAYHSHWLDEIGFLAGRKNTAVAVDEFHHGTRHDRVPVSKDLIERLSSRHEPLRRVLHLELGRSGTLSRWLAEDAYEATKDTELGHLLGFFYDTVASAELGEDELTYDLSVPENLTYVANGFVSHNTIGLMMDCDTTGIEPDLGLVKAKKLVGGGTMRIVNQTVPVALTHLGYQPEQIEAIIAYIDEHATIEGAPAFKEEHLPVFDCAMGERSISAMGHVQMMAAVQPFISGAISKCVTGDSLITTGDGLVRIGSLHQGESADTFRDEVIEVASLGGPTKTDAFYYGGLRHVREVVLRSGHRITGTDNHRVLVAGETGLDWRYLDALQPGDYVAVQYGTDMWSPVPARFQDFEPKRAHGSQKTVRIPDEMTEDLAFLLGAYASEGHTSRTNWTIRITNSADTVLERVAQAWRNVFGVEPVINRPANRCADVAVASKTIVEFLNHLGCGTRASNKRIPDAVLRSPKPMVLAFLQGLALDAYTSVSTMPKWAICLDSKGLLDDLQAVLTNLGIVHGRVTKQNAEYDKCFDEVYAVGRHAARLAWLVPFMEPDKAARAALLPDRATTRNSADIVPGVTGRQLYDLLPAGRAGGTPTKSVEWRFLLDKRTRNVSRGTLERVAAVPGVVLPDWLQQVLDDDLHFSPAASVVDSGEREVFDVSVPTTHAFVGNGMVNHNTVNLPESATVEDVEEMYIEGWKLGLKALAIYRDNCKVAQPLSLDKKKPEVAAATDEEAAQHGMVRRRLPKQRPSQTISFQVGDAEGYLTAGEYPGDGLGEIFVKLGKQGSTLSGVMDAFAISVSLGLQYGVPLEAYVKKFTNMRFEPAGMTDDPEVKFASSLVDYIFRRLAIEYLPVEKRQELGIYTLEERSQSLDGGGYPPQPPQPAAPQVDPAGQTVLPVEESKPVDDVHGDAPMCYQCGVTMIRSGSCHCCPQCGTTSGCS